MFELLNLKSLDRKPWNENHSPWTVNREAVTEILI